MTVAPNWTFGLKLQTGVQVWVWFGQVCRRSLFQDKGMLEPATVNQASLSIPVRSLLREKVPIHSFRNTIVQIGSIPELNSTCRCDLVKFLANQVYVPDFGRESLKVFTTP